MNIDVDRRITIDWKAADLDQFCQEVYYLQLQPLAEYVPCNGTLFERRYPLIARILREAS